MPGRRLTLLVLLATAAAAACLLSTATALSPQPEPPLSARWADRSSLLARRYNPGAQSAGLTTTAAAKGADTQLGMPGTGDREGGFFAACDERNAVFKTVDCVSWGSAIRFQGSGGTNPVNCDSSYIECGEGDSSEGRKAERYHIEVNTGSGLDAKGKPAYSANARIMHDRATQPDKYYCWKRVGAGGDGCGCICAVVLQGSALGRRPECKCV